MTIKLRDDGGRTVTLTAVPLPNGQTALTIHIKGRRTTIVESTVCLTPHEAEALAAELS